MTVFPAVVILIHLRAGLSINQAGLRQSIIMGFNDLLNCKAAFGIPYQEPESPQKIPRE